MNKLYIVILLIFLTNVSIASHLIGGNMGYEYIGQFGSNFRYKIILTTYTNCGPDSQIPTPESGPLQAGIYAHDIGGSPMGGGNKTHVTTIGLTKVTEYQIDPNLPSNCPIGNNVCIYKAIYEGFVDLPLSFNGYHIFYERCCRNASIVNLVLDESMAFHAFISPTLLKNNSPKFTDDPIPFICSGDTTSILNSAYDPDGDLLIFNFAHPYNGFSDANDPAPAPPSGGLNWPIPLVNYSGGYSTANPFGPSGYKFINSSTGLTKYYPANSGDYVIAVEIKEYRNGNLIGITRRDLQVLVLNCPGNPAPQLSPSLGTTNTSFTVEEGATLCFTYGFKDPNFNNLTLQTNGTVFNPAYVNPPATGNNVTTGNTNVQNTFCWTTQCGQARTQPYMVQTSAQDDGCPPKTGNKIFQITVQPVNPPSSISGPNLACLNNQETYSAAAIANTTYTWSVTGGNIVQNNGNSITVQWTSQGTGTINLFATNQYGCSSIPLTKEITVAGAFSIDAGTSSTLCLGDSLTLSATSSNNSNVSFSWSPNNNLIGANTLNPSVFPNNTTTYYLTATQAGACTITDSVTVVVESVNVNAGIDTTICSDGTAILNGSSSGGNFTWSPSGTLANAGTLNPTASPNTTTSYILTTTSVSGCTNKDTVTVLVDQEFTLVTTPDEEICAGECVNLNAQNGQNYSWNNAGSLNNSTIANPLACPVVSTTYTVISTKGTCSDTAQINIIVNPNPIATVIADTSLCEGDTIQLTSGGGNSYTWTGNNLSSNNVQNPLASPVASGTYQVIVSNTFGCDDTATVMLDVNPKPQTNAGPEKFICISMSNGSGTPSEVLEGTGNGTPVWNTSYGLSDSTVFNPIISPGTTTTYFLTVTSDKGCTDGDSVVVTVFSEAPIDAGRDTIICPGDSVIIGGNPTSLGDLTTYSWGSTGFIENPTVANPKVYVTGPTWFYLSVSNDTCTGYDSVLVSIAVPPVANAGLDAQICINQSVQLSASGGVNYSWTPGNLLDNNNLSDPIATPTDTTLFIVEVFDTLGCSSFDSVLVTVNPLPILLTSASGTICNGDSLQITVSGAQDYTWSPNQNISDINSPNPFVYPTSNETYIVNALDSNGCENSSLVNVIVNALPMVEAGSYPAICIYDTIQLNATGANIYEWISGNNISNSNISNPLVNPTSGNYYTVIGTDLNNCQNIDSVFIGVNLLPVINAGNDKQICIGDSASLSVSGASIYNWSPSDFLSSPNGSSVLAYPNDTTNYIVFGTDLNNCSNVDTIAVIVNPLPNIEAGLDQNLCLGDTAFISASGGEDYLWSGSSGIIAPTTASTYLLPDTTTWIFVEVTDSNSCRNYDSLLLDVFNIGVFRDTTICNGDSLQLLLHGSEGQTFTWSPTQYLSDSLSNSPWASPDASTTFFITVTDNFGCIDRDSIHVNVNPSPILDFDWVSEPGCEGLIVYFNNKSTGGTSFSWLHGDQIFSNEENPEHILPFNGNHNITLIGYTENNCEASIDTTLIAPTFDELFNIYIPNVFTPNGDDLNEEFDVQVDGKLNNCVDLKIFNRWGQLIFKTTGNDISWDGKNTLGEASPDGVYYYTIEIKDYKYNGSLHLYR